MHKYYNVYVNQMRLLPMKARKSNINMRATEEEKHFLQKASEIAGFSNLTNFIMTAARKEAMKVISDQSTTYVSPADWELIHKLMANPPEPNEYLKKLLSDREA